MSVVRERYNRNSALTRSIIGRLQCTRCTDTFDLCLSGHLVCVLVVG